MTSVRSRRVRSDADCDDDHSRDSKRNRTQLEFITPSPDADNINESMEPDTLDAYTQHELPLIRDMMEWALVARISERERHSWAISNPGVVLCVMHHRLTPDLRPSLPGPCGLCSNSLPMRSFTTEMALRDDGDPTSLRQTWQARFLWRRASVACAQTELSAWLSYIASVRNFTPTDFARTELLYSQARIDIGIRFKNGRLPNTLYCSQHKQMGVLIPTSSRTPLLECRTCVHLESAFN